MKEMETAETLLVTETVEMTKRLKNIPLKGEEEGTLYQIVAESAFGSVVYLLSCQGCYYGGDAYTDHLPYHL